MIRFGDETFAAARGRAIGAGLAATFAGSGVRAESDPATGEVAATDPLGRRTRFVPDRRGFVGAVVSPLGRRWEVRSDPKGRPLGFATPAGGRLDLAYDASGQLARIGRGERPLCTLDRDGAGRVAACRFPDGTSTRLDHDDRGRVATLTDRRGAARTFEHTPDGLLAAMTDGRGHRTQFEYADLDRPARATLPDGSASAFDYDAAGRVRSIAAADGTTTTLGHDAAGNLAAVEAGGEVSRFVRDERGRVVRAENGTTVVEFAYDDAGRVVKESRAGATVRYEYDAAGTLTALAYPTGERVAFRRDDDLRLTGVTAWDGSAYEFDHAPDDRWLTIRAPGGVVTSVELSPEGQVAEVAARAPLRPSAGGRPPTGGHDLFATAYRYDAEGRLAAAVDSEHGETSFRYDAEGQLVAAGRESFAYDAAGNRVEAHGEAATFDAADRLLAQGRSRCSYDGRGNLAELRDGAATWRFTWDARDRLVRADGPDGRAATFGYDAFGRRVWKKSGDLTTHFFWAGEQLIREVRSDATSRDYLYPPGSSAPLAIRERGVIYTVHADHLGTPRRLTGPDGAVAWSADYDAFGRARPTTAKVDHPIRLPGHYLDDETGLHYNRFRYYSPTLGRYLSRDPASYLGGPNLYAYAGNDPINVADPTGLWPSWGTVASVVAAVAVGAAVIAFAPVALPAAIILAGAAAGAVGAGLNQALNEQTFCAECIATAALKGALVGAVAAVPFALLPAAAGVGAFLGVGGLSGGIGYVADHALSPGTPWSWGGFAASVALGAATAGAGRYLGGRYAQARAGSSAAAEEAPVAGRAVDPPAPPEPPDPVYRGDVSPTSPVNAKGIPKSHLNANGDLVPANPTGMYKGREVTVPEHILGGFRRGAKSNSPYTSFTPDGSTAAGYGGQRMTVDLAALRRGIAAGEVEGVEVVDQARIQQMIRDDPNLGDYWKNLASKWAARDQEVLIKGTIPERYIRLEPGP